jgi:type II secretory pathway pseudopilin PulG
MSAKIELFPYGTLRCRTVLGFTLVETTVVLGIIAIVLGALWVVASQVRAAHQVSKGSQELVAIVQNVRAVFAEQGGVDGSQGSNINQALDQLKVFPLDMRQDQSTAAGIIFHPWDQTLTVGGGGGGGAGGCAHAGGCSGGVGHGVATGSVVIYSDDCTGNEAQSGPEPCFGVTFFNVPQAPCINLLAQETSQSAAGLRQIQVNGEPLPSLPVLLSQAAAACNNGNADSNNDILWIYLLRS